MCDDNDELGGGGVCFKRPSHLLDNQPCLDSFGHVQTLPVEKPLGNGPVDAAGVADIPAGYGGRHMPYAVLPETCIRGHLRVDSDGIGTPLLLHEDHLVVVETVAHPGLRAATDRLVAARDGFAHEEPLAPRAASSSASSRLEHLIAFNLEET